MSATGNQAAGDGHGSDRLVRHRLPDRAYHWLMAVCVLVLIATGFLPILGVKFGWVVPHWIAGLVLTVAVLFHVVRALFWQDLRAMLVGPQDLRDAWGACRAALGRGAAAPKPGKYSLMQKLYHAVVGLSILAVSVTGCLMLVKIDTPWWKRDPYWLADHQWAVVYVAHDLTAMGLITLVMVHVYLGLRPDKLWFTRSMVRGWITRDEFTRYHDPRRWAPAEQPPRRRASPRGRSDE